MLKHRQDGLVFLHGLFLDGAIIALFLLQIAVADWSGWIEFNTGVRWGVYLMGVVGAMVWNHHALPGMAARLGALTFRETLRLTRQQLARLVAVLCALAFAMQDVAISRLFIASFSVLAGGVLMAANWGMPRWLARTLFRALQFRSVVLATPADADQLQGWLAARRYLGQTVAGCLRPAGTPAPAVAGVPQLGEVSALRRVLAAGGVNQVVIDRRRFTPAELGRILAMADEAACRVRFFVDLPSLLGGETGTVEHHERYAFAAQTPEPLDNPVNGLLKRALDLAIAVPVVCCVLPPLTLLVWGMQRRQSRGPVFYRQERSGMNGQRFHIFKYRTMHVAAGAEARQATRHDARVFAFGRFLRTTSLDEFPQFLNVLLGEMSVSGPRPHLLEHDREFAALVAPYYKRHYVKPGITGLAQSAGLRGEVTGRPELLRQRIAHDLRYVNGWSLELDLKIMAATARQLVRPPRAAY